MQSFVMHTYEASAMPPYHAYAYDSAGNPLSERQAKEISERLQFWPSGARDLMMMVLPAEAAPDLETIRRVVVSQGKSCQPWTMSDTPTISSGARRGPGVGSRTASLDPDDP